MLLNPEPLAELPVTPALAAKALAQKVHQQLEVPFSGKLPHGQEPEPIHEAPRSVSPEVERQAAEAKAAREAAKADPRDFVTESKYDPIPMTEAETYCNLMGRLQMEAQQLEVWLTGRLNLYGTDGLNMLRKELIWASMT